jgi:hypothetical protein
MAPTTIAPPQALTLAEDFDASPAALKNVAKTNNIRRVSFHPNWYDDLKSHLSQVKT